SPRFFHRLLHRYGYLLGLALADANPAVTVADDRERGEGENASALHHLGDAVDGDHLFAQTVAAIILLLPALLPAHWLCHMRSRWSCLSVGARTSSRPRGRRRPALSRGRDT